MKSEDITGGLDLLGDWLDAKGYTEEAGLCTRAMDEINRLRTALETREAQVFERNAVILHIYNACDHYLRSGKNIEVEQ